MPVGYDRYPIVQGLEVGNEFPEGRNPLRFTHRVVSQPSQAS